MFQYPFIVLNFFPIVRSVISIVIIIVIGQISYLFENIFLVASVAAVVDVSFILNPIFLVTSEYDNILIFQR